MGIWPHAKFQRSPSSRFRDAEKGGTSARAHVHHVRTCMYPTHDLCNMGRPEGRGIALLPGPRREWGSGSPTYRYPRESNPPGLRSPAQRASAIPPVRLSRDRFGRSLERSVRSFIRTISSVAHYNIRRCIIIAVKSRIH